MEESNIRRAGKPHLSIGGAPLPLVDGRVAGMQIPVGLYMVYRGNTSTSGTA